MISLIAGKILEKKPTSVIIDCNGIGYLLLVSVITSSKLPEIGDSVRLLTVLIPREDQILLFGFIDESERELFKSLISISGIGPKTAIGILSAASPAELANYIQTENIRALQKLPGIGKKSAERLLIELKDKISKLSITGEDLLGENALLKSEAVAALCALGYNRSVAEKAVKKVYDENAGKINNIETLIKLSLQFAMEIK
ncbi:MAG: Holliday junction branch migration protein RuvA [Bacteroidota bacterium]